MDSTFSNQKCSNPLADLITDETFFLLKDRGLINEKSVRDYEIRNKFLKLRNKKISATEAITSLRDEYPYLQYDTLRKIVYQIK